MKRKDVTFANINDDNCKYISMIGDNSGRVNLIIDINNNRLFFSYSGSIVCELTENLRAIWNSNVSDKVKVLIRKNIQLLKK